MQQVSTLGKILGGNDVGALAELSSLHELTSHAVYIEFSGLFATLNVNINVTIGDVSLNAFNNHVGNAALVVLTNDVGEVCAGEAELNIGTTATSLS